MDDDATLLHRYAEEKSEAAFAELVRRHLDLVYSAALRRLGGDAHRAADVAQQVFTTLAHGAEKLSRHAVLTAWLYAATRNAAIDFIRAEQRRSAREQEASTMQTLMSATPDAEWEKLRPVLDEAMDELSDTDRTAVLMRFFEKRAFAEVGAALHLSEDAARMRIARALDKLRALLARRGVTSTSTALAIVLTNQAVALAPATLAATVTAGAVAGVTVSSGAALAGGAFAFMSTSKLAVGIAIIVAAIGIGSAIYEVNLAERSARELTAVRQQHRAAAAKNIDLESKLRAAEQNVEAAVVRVTALEKDLALAKSAASAAPRPAAASVSSVGKLWAIPGYGRLYVDKYHASLPLRYGPLYRALNLSPDQIAKFESALTESQQGVVDIWTAASARGLMGGGDTATSTSIARMTSAPMGAAQETLKAVLGPDGYEKYRQFDQAHAVRDLVTTLAGNVYYSETPLTGPQGDALAESIKTNSKSVKVLMANDGKGPIYRISEKTDWDAVYGQTQNLLSPLQLAALRSLAEQARLDREMTEIQRPSPPPAGKQPGG